MINSPEEDKHQISIVMGSQSDWPCLKNASTRGSFFRTNPRTFRDGLISINVWELSTELAIWKLNWQIRMKNSDSNVIYENGFPMSTGIRKSRRVCDHVQ